VNDDAEWRPVAVVTGTVVVDLSDLPRYDTSTEARRRLSAIETAPAGSRVVIRVGQLMPLPSMTDIPCSHVHIDIESPDAEIVRHWVTAFRAEVSRRT